jgi:hypothetical protein
MMVDNFMVEMVSFLGNNGDIESDKVGDIRCD